MKTKTKIEKQLKKKTNPELVETIISAKKQKNWVGIAGLLSTTRKKQVNLNLEDLDKVAKEGETLIVPGKVLSQGEFNKKNKIIALKFSGKAKEKLLKSGNKIDNILNEIKSNPEAKGIQIIKNLESKK